MNYEERINRLDDFIARDAVIRGKWTDGQERACLLAALSPEAGEREDATACPASVMPAWLAYLTPSLDDKGSVEAWPSMVRRYAALARRWSVLDANAWVRLDFRARVLAMRMAREQTTYQPALDAIDLVVELCERGPSVTPEEWSAAYSAAYSAADSAAYLATDSAAYLATDWAAYSAARSAARSAADSAAYLATDWAADSAADSAAYSAAYLATDWAAYSAARSTARDRFTVELFDAIEAEIVKVENA